MSAEFQGADDPSKYNTPADFYAGPNMRGYWCVGEFEEKNADLTHATGRLIDQRLEGQPSQEEYVNTTVGTHAVYDEGLGVSQGSVARVYLASSFAYGVEGPLVAVAISRARTAAGTYYEIKSDEVTLKWHEGSVYPTCWTAARNYGGLAKPDTVVTNMVRVRDGQPFDPATQEIAHDKIIQRVVPEVPEERRVSTGRRIFRQVLGNRQRSF